jgi:uncharacterized protein DUF6892
MGAGSIDPAIDLAALAKLRPGMPVSALESALGNHWVPLRNENAGYFWGRILNIPLNARVDVNGVIGQIGIERKFPPWLEVERLRVGMTLPEAKAAQPGLRLIKMFEEERGIATFGATLADGIELAVRFQNHELLWFTLTRPGSSYPDPKLWTQAPAGKYPAPDAVPGAPFADPNFKLIVLDALREAGVIDLGSPRELTGHVLGRHADATKEDRGLVRDYLMRFSLTDEQLATVETLIFEGSLSIYDYAGLSFNFEGSDADVKSLAGIERLGNLRRFCHSSMLADLDLSRLAGLDRLESVSLGDRFASPRTLLALPSLKVLECYPDSVDDPTVIAALEANGVKVTIFC